MNKNTRPPRGVVMAYNQFIASLFMINTQMVDIAKGERENALLETQRLRSLSDRERGEEILAACRLAAAIYAGRLKSGSPPLVSDPWPASTWEFLRKHAANATRS